MLKPSVKRNLMLDFVSDEFSCPENIDDARIFTLNDKIGSGAVVYLMSRELRFQDNWGFIFAHNLAQKTGKNLKVLCNLDEKIYSKRQIEFNLPHVKNLSKIAKKNDIDFEFIKDDLQKYLKIFGALVIDFNPVLKFDKAAKSFVTKDFAAQAIFEIDSHNIIPARFISDKQEFSAATLRRKVYVNIGRFLTEFKNPFPVEKSEAQEKMFDFIENKLNYYTELKNDPTQNFVSGLSPYLHSGQISAQRVALEVLKSNASRENKEAFLEELIVRKELSDNFCLYSKDFKSLKSTPAWAKKTLEEHKFDIRPYVYDLKIFEDAKTHDELWNAAQKDLVQNGKIHGYMRMYWAKKILEWSQSPEEALKTAIYLNDKYALDGNDANGYVGILWSIVGVHDRAFSSRPVMGKIRYMSAQGCKNKFDVKRYIEKI
ncbi:MAG TPA: hypothetical protein PLG15_01510 [Candidatus Gastranaerophilaceae bacterium]|nr:hypothetical protein [Candidatus Gastranaerophilaceae bacterium]HPT41044.1 hypothetical protein [Candidatus Gastranaerophilaceae bacterium]